jgi:hypothetical protein
MANVNKVNYCTNRKVITVYIIRTPTIFSCGPLSVLMSLVQDDLLIAFYFFNGAHD